jgi:hypothetical protein
MNLAEIFSFAVRAAWNTLECNGTRHKDALLVMHHTKALSTAYVIPAGKDCSKLPHIGRRFWLSF